MDHKARETILTEIANAEEQITVGATYAHYKNPDHTCTVEGFGLYEATDELCVVYKANYPPHLTFFRAVSVWLELVEWNGKEVPRFRKLD